MTTLSFGEEAFRRDAQRTLIEKWRAEAKALGMIYERAQVLAHCADDLEDACTPRQPKPEWFGTCPGQWDAWWITTVDSSAGTCRDLRELHSLLNFDQIVACVPVAREGFPAPAGWQVVEGER